MKKGNKAESLEKLRKSGLLVPSFFVCDNSWSKKKLQETIEKKLSGVTYFAVRSSALHEDTKKKSFAGQYYSGIGIAKKDVYKEVLKVHLSYGTTLGSVIVQAFIPSDVAGVLFTQSTEGNIVINATVGLCLSVVQGQACDEYICDIHGNVIHKTVAEEKHIAVFQKGVITSKVTHAESLTDNQLYVLSVMAQKIQEFFASPQDIEWCFKDDTLYVLQSRPITKSVSTKSPATIYFDSANIAESYSGIVLPLTCSFARMVYSQVYKDLLRMSGVSAKKLIKHDALFQNLLGFFYGRMYYNMNNWYLLAAFLPGYNRNKENFELMITSNIKESIVRSIQPSRIITLLYPLIVITKIIFVGLTSRYFIWIVTKELQSLRSYDFTKLDYSETKELFERINQRLLRRWYITLENDFLVMTYLGILKKLLGETDLQKVITFHSKATQQVHAITVLSKKMRKSKSLWKTIEEDDTRTFTRELQKHSDVKKLLDDYLGTFGGRFANELKLETVGIDEDTTKLFAILKVYKDFTEKPTTTIKPIVLPKAKKYILYIVLSKFKKYAKRREEFRLLRSNTFGVARRLFRQMGKLLVEKKVIHNVSDVFYLTVEEILDEKILEKTNVARTISERKKEYEVYQKISPPTHFATTDNTLPPVSTKTKLPEKNIQARPASEGIVTGRVKVFNEFSMPEKIDFDILVTSHTDPGWTSLIALSKGLIIEHGGVLSHASIVARELQIPAVIGATNALSTLKDNQLVRIDGSTGIITLLS